MVNISSFLLSWWYSPDTKLAITFQTAAASLVGLTELSSSNGLSASVEENYRLENTITEHPIESGVSISDHIISMPKVISITGLLTAIDTIPIVGTGILNFNQLGSAIQLLFNAADSKDLFTLTTGLYFGHGFFNIRNVAIQSIDIPRNNQYGRTSIKFNIVFKEVIITSPNPTTNNTSTQGALDPNVSGVI